jgi:hypothetical protein
VRELLEVEPLSALRIGGLVRMANRARRELAQPLSAQQRAHLQGMVTEALAQVDRILAQHGAQLQDLPAPTRRAYAFLASLDFAAPAPQASTDAAPPPRGSVSLTGLTSFWQHILDGLAQAATPDAQVKLYESIRTTSQKIERQLRNEQLGAAQLAVPSRAAFSWLLFFAERSNFDEYLAALGRATPILTAGVAALLRFPAPVRVHFRPGPGLYRVRGGPDGTRAMLPTPMITFSAELFMRLAELMFRGAPTRQLVLEATASEAYQDLLAELDARAGVAEHAQGAFHDLSASFERVRQAYFDGTLTRPRLTWSRTFTGRKLGHYDRITDTVMISCSLDRADLPTVALDFLIFHELLHKQLGVTWTGGRMAVHTPEFRAAEQRFAHYAEAEALLKKLART